MLLTKKDLEQHLSEIEALYRQYLSEEVNGVTHFGIIVDEELQAIAAVKCYSGHWYLRACVVKPDYRGRGLQRQLIVERLEYLAQRTDTVRVSIHPDNIHSIQNIRREGFQFEKMKELKNGKIVQVYKRTL